MKNKLLLGAMLIGTAGLFMACSDDNDSNPTLLQPTGFVLNTPAYVNETVNLEASESLRLTWSQPKFTSDNAPVNVTYEVQVSLDGNYTVSAAEADADEEGNTVADYAAIDKTVTTCYADVSAADINKALMRVAKWEDGAVPETHTAFIRMNAFVAEGTVRHNSVVSNVIEVTVNPYYVELKDADPIMWYIVGSNISDTNWSHDPGVTSYPLFLQSGYTYDKATGAGEIVYLNYFTTDGWKLQPSDYDWYYGFMGNGANKAVYRDGGDDNGNIWCDPAGYYLVTVNTGDLTCTIEPQDIHPTVYAEMAISGSFNDWTETLMTPVNNTGENHVWAYVLTVAEGEVAQIKFLVPGTDWATNWGYGAANGEINTCGNGTANGSNIGVPEGTWVIMFNDINGAFSIVAK